MLSLCLAALKGRPHKIESALQFRRLRRRVVECEVAMRIFDKVRMAARALLQRGASEGELHDELAFHIERQTAENVRAGMTAVEARRAAMIEFGGVEFTKVGRPARSTLFPYTTLFRCARHPCRGRVV